MTGKAKDGADIAAMTFEAALAELEQIVRQLESGTGDLQGAIDAYARGVALKRHCAARLQDAQMRIEKIGMDADGGVVATPLEQTPNRPEACDDGLLNK